ncbi:hypothetical protein HAX54_043471 [Datura stramonium]|uniref:Uncharacterized protein n=1 Tax=Datura stramonium TaxID=4076 RepID=A0ABS8W2N3_DATST|nr:hypothetical protein [Datura stramonium]
MSAKLTEMMTDTTTCNDLQFKVLANTQEEPQVEGRIELRQEIDHLAQEKESPPLDDYFLVDADVEEVDKSEDVKHNAILELGGIGPHSKHLFDIVFGWQSRNRAFQAYGEMCR